MIACSATEVTLKYMSNMDRYWTKQYEPFAYFFGYDICLNG